MKTYTISRYRDAVKDPPPDAWVGGVLLEGDDYPTGASRLCGAFWADSGGEIHPVKWLSENEPATPKLYWDKLRERVEELRNSAMFREIFTYGVEQIMLSTVRMYYQDILKIMDEMEAEDEKEV